MNTVLLLTAFAALAVPEVRASCSASAATGGDFQELPLQTCAPNQAHFEAGLCEAPLCRPIGNSCDHCASVEYQQGSAVCAPLDSPFVADDGGLTNLTGIRCAPMYMPAATMNNAWTQVTWDNATTNTPADMYEYFFINGAEQMGTTPALAICGMVDPTEATFSLSQVAGNPIVDSFTAGSTALENPAIAPQIIRPNGDEVAGTFNYQQVVRCKENTASPTRNPTTMPSASPVEPTTSAPTVTTSESCLHEANALVITIAFMLALLL